MHMWTWTLDQGLVYVRLVVVLSPNYLLHDVLAIAKQHENHWQDGLLSTHSPWAKWNLESVNFFFFFEKVTLYYQNSTRFFTATHTHTYIYAHPLHIRCTYRVILFLENGTFFTKLFFFLSFFPSQCISRSHFRQLNSKLWVSELWVSWGSWQVQD